MDFNLVFDRTRDGYMVKYNGPKIPEGRHSGF